MRSCPTCARTCSTIRSGILCDHTHRDRVERLVVNNELPAKTSPSWSSLPGKPRGAQLCVGRRGHAGSSGWRDAEPAGRHQGRARPVQRCGAGAGGRHSQATRKYMITSPLAAGAHMNGGRVRAGDGSGHSDTEHGDRAAIESRDRKGRRLAILLLSENVQQR